MVLIKYYISRNAPCVAFRNIIGQLRPSLLFRRARCSNIFASTLNTLSISNRSCKHRGRAHGHRQRRCEEQGGCFLRQFHNLCLAMGPAADGQPWICLLLSHLMVVYPQFSFLSSTLPFLPTARGLSQRSVSASQCRCWFWWCGPNDRAGTPHRPGTRRG